MSHLHAVEIEPTRPDSGQEPFAQQRNREVTRRLSLLFLLLGILVGIGASQLLQHGQPHVQAYRVSRGDTGTSIAATFGVPLARLKQLNPSVQWEKLKAGSKIRVPRISDETSAEKALAASLANPPGIRFDAAAPIPLSGVVVEFSGRNLETINPRVVGPQGITVLDGIPVRGWSLDQARTEAEAMAKAGPNPLVIQGESDSRETVTLGAGAAIRALEVIARESFPGMPIVFVKLPRAGFLQRG